MCQAYIRSGLDSRRFCVEGLLEGLEVDGGPVGPFHLLHLARSVGLALSVVVGVVEAAARTATTSTIPS